MVTFFLIEMFHRNPELAETFQFRGQTEMGFETKLTTIILLLLQPACLIFLTFMISSYVEIHGIKG